MSASNINGPSQVYNTSLIPNIQALNNQLFKACKSGDAALVALSIRNGANKEALDEDGLSPLHLACFNGHEAIVRVLLEAGASNDLANNDGNSPLHLACLNGHEAIVRILLEA